MAPDTRVRLGNQRPVQGDGQFILYWQIAARRTRYNFALEHALARADELGRPLLVLEPLRCDYRWASDRLHRFVLAGMLDNARAYAEANIAYHPYVEPSPGAGRGLLQALASRACLVVTDDFPCFFLPRMIAAAGEWLTVRLEIVDGNGLLPLSTAPKDFLTAYAFRRFLQGHLRQHLAVVPSASPFASVPARVVATLPMALTEKFPAASRDLLAGIKALADLPIDHAVGPSPLPGGSVAAAEQLLDFLAERLPRYAMGRNHPDEDASSGLSPYLHFGQLSAHEIFLELAKREHWDPSRLAAAANGKRSGWWGMSPAAEAFLDQLVTWRELGYVMCARRPDDYDQYSSLPEWARRTLEAHATDIRPFMYPLADLEAARTHDPLWNAAQRQLVANGHIHNYLRMLWGKKILEWSPTPKEALANMIALNDKYALDGRDPNSYSGIFWILGRYDRPWAPQRPIVGCIRYMSSANTARKLHLRDYLRRWA